jgi:hypothetical protein
MARPLHSDLAPARFIITRCGEMGTTTLRLGSKSVNYVVGLKCQRCPRPGSTKSSQSGSESKISESPRLRRFDSEMGIAEQ